jgi:CxxC motif-containing protein (DUF1111 family)
LRKPTYGFSGATVPANFSARISPQLVGMGLLEAISESDIQALADPDDANHDVTGPYHPKAEVRKPPLFLAASQEQRHPGDGCRQPSDDQPDGPVRRGTRE